MATTLTRNLKLKIDSNLTASAKYNLERIDALGGTYLNDDTETVQVRSIGNIILLPNNSSIGGSGVGGTISLGQPSQLLDEIQLNSVSVLVNNGLALKDTALTSAGKLILKYKSDLNGSLDNTARNLTIDTDGGDRSVILAGNLSILGGSITLTGPSNLTLPSTGTAATLANPETFSNKTINANSNTILNLTNASIDSAADIDYSKLNLAGSIVNADISNSAAIAYSKLNLNNSILASDLVGSIPYSKLDLGTSIVDADISFSAAIEGIKILPDFGSQDIKTQGKLTLSNGTHSTSLKAPPSGIVSDVTWALPVADGTNGQVITTDGAGNLGWASVATGASGRELTAVWNTGDGASKVVTHNWGSAKVMVQLLDIGNNYETILADAVKRTSNNSVTLTASEAPGGSGWLILLKELVG